MKVLIIVAMTPDGIIGNAGGLPWHEPEDLRHFKRTTTGHAVIMGRKTFDSIRRPLPGRRNIVISRSRLTTPRPTDDEAQNPEAGTAAGARDEQRVREGAACPRTPGTALDFVASLEAALDLCRARGERDVFIAGGAQIYALALPVAEEMIVSWIDRPGIAGDTRFPEWRREEWLECGHERVGELIVARFRRRGGPPFSSGGFS